MKTTRFLPIIMTVMIMVNFNAVKAQQWATNGNNIYNLNSGKVCIGNGVYFTPDAAVKLHINSFSNPPAGIMCESSYSGTQNTSVGNIRLRNSYTQNMFNITLRKNGTVDEMLQSCYIFGDTPPWREFIYFNFGTRKYEMRNGIMDAEYQNSGNLLFNMLGNVGIGTTSPNSSSLVDMTSTSKGFLAPRMTSADRLGITQPANGLLLYQTDNPTGFFFNSGTSGSPAWQRLAVTDSCAWQVSYVTNYVSLKSPFTRVGIGTTAPLANFHTVGSYIHLDSGPDNSWGRESVVTQQGTLDANGDLYVLIAPAYYWGWSNDNYMFKIEVYVSLDYDSDWPHVNRGSGYSRALVGKERGNNLTYFYKEIELSKDATITFLYSNSAPQDLRIDINTDRGIGISYKVVVKISS